MLEDSVAIRVHSLRGDSSMPFMRSSNEGAEPPDSAAPLVVPGSRVALGATPAMASSAEAAGPAAMPADPDSAEPHRLQKRAESLASVPHCVHFMVVSPPFPLTRAINNRLERRNPPRPMVGRGGLKHASS
jgi:hypothetical protein